MLRKVLRCIGGGIVIVGGALGALGAAAMFFLTVYALVAWLAP